MAVSANRKAQAGKLHQREHRPLIRAFLKSLKKVTIMQSSNSTQIQNIQNQAVVMASTCHASGFAAIVYEPIAYYDDLKACSSIARPLGIYPSQGAAILACKSFINSISDDLKEWATYSVTKAG